MYNMNKWSFLFLGLCLTLCTAKAPFKPRKGIVNFVVYFPSRYRGVCVGVLAARMVVLTAAVCVVSPNSQVIDRSPINVVVGTIYRHQRRGVRVQVTRTLVPKLDRTQPYWSALIQSSPAVLILSRRVPDILAEVPLQPIEIDWRGDLTLSLQQHCVIAGWHFFYKGDKIYPGHKFLLQRNLRVQFVNIVKAHLHCEDLILKYERVLQDLAADEYQDQTAHICVIDAEREAQSCHGMYGAPLVCKGRAVGLMMAPDAQWTNCTHYSNIIHLFTASYIKLFMECVSRLFVTDTRVNWDHFVKHIYDETVPEYDYWETVYDKIIPNPDD